VSLTYARSGEATFRCEGPRVSTNVGVAVGGTETKNCIAGVATKEMFWSGAPASGGERKATPRATQKTSIARGPAKMLRIWCRNNHSGNKR